MHNANVYLVLYCCIFSFILYTTIKEYRRYCMAKKRPAILESKRFSFIIAAVILLISIYLLLETRIFDNSELKTLDLHFQIKELNEKKYTAEGVTKADVNPNISSDIIILSIDQKSLNEFGQWPFSRSIHANLINAFARIKDQTERENALLIDIFFNEPGKNPEADAALFKAIEESQRVFIETILTDGEEITIDSPRFQRQQEFYTKHGTITNIQGNWQKIADFVSLDPPLPEIARASAGYGHASFLPDFDKVFRQQPMILRSRVLLKTIQFEDITPGYTVDTSKFEYLAWIDTNGRIHPIQTPITSKVLNQLKHDLALYAPKKLNEAGDGYYIIRHYRDYFVPAITLSLALNYFHKSFNDIKVVVGKYIEIPNPMILDPETNELIPYFVQRTFDEYNSETGELVKPGKREVVNTIRIPINDSGQMLINYMGPRSNAEGGYQTFTLRSYASYAKRDPGDNAEKWLRTLAVKNKILLTGAFSHGIAEDEKQTPYGLMYGIEIHANALNTILTNNYIKQLPKQVTLLILLVSVLLISLITSRTSTVWSFLTVLGFLIIYFFTVDIIFEKSGLLLPYPTIAFPVFITFLSIVVYRAFTDEKDKKAIRETFGKYLSPKVVDQLVQNPPELGGVDKELTVFFSDIRGFTTLSENMTPQELVNHLNIYLTAMTDIILEYGGTIDKYMGDAIMAFWGAPLPQPNHAELACKCALKQLQVLSELNAQWPESKRINIGIGLNSDIMTVGNMGSKLRMNYTLMGDPVNLGSRLESTNKEYGTKIIISEFTYAHIKDKFIVRELDNIRVKGKNKPVLIYELVDCLEDITPPVETKAKNR